MESSCEASRTASPRVAFGVAWLLAAASAAKVCRAAYIASYASLGRDQGIFQYVAWAITKGARDYQDIRDVNGPLTHLVHLVFLSLGGRDEHVFRSLDLAVTFATFAVAGAAVSTFAPRPALLRTQLLLRASWALAGVVVLGAQYVHYLSWDMAQRETYCDWFVLLGLAAALVAGDPCSPKSARGRRALFAGSGFSLGIACYGKHIFGTMVLVQLLGIWVDREAPLRRRARWTAFVSGVALAGLAGLAFVAAVGSVPGFLRLYLVEGPSSYRYMWPRSPLEIAQLPWAENTGLAAAATATFGLALLAFRKLPARALPVLLFAPAAALGIAAQGKGFPYHFHPLTLALHLAWMLLLAWGSGLASRRHHPPEAPRALVGRWFTRSTLAPLAVGLGALSLSRFNVDEVERSLFFACPWMPDLGATAELRQTRAYLERFRGNDFFPFELRQAAAFVQEKTPRGARVQMYGTDPYLLFLAERLSATPYLYAFDIDAEAAAEGALATLSPAEGSSRAARIRASAQAHADDLAARLAASEVAAFVFIDKDPFMREPSAPRDLENSAPRAAAWLSRGFEEAASFNEVHVYLPREKATAAVVPRSGGD